MAKWLSMEERVQRILDANLPAYLFDAWGSTHKEDPLALARQWYTDKRLRDRRFSIGMMIVVLGAFVFVATAFFMSDTMGTADENDVLLVLIGLIIAALLLVAGMVVAHTTGFPNDSHQATDDRTAYLLRCFDDLCEVIGGFSVLENSSFEETKSRATDVLVGQAVLVRTADENGQPTSYSVDSLIELKRLYDLLKTFGLADGGYGPYFEKAARRLGATS